MDVIFHITTGEEWERARRAGALRSSSLDTEGFIHCSTREQVIETANRFFRGMKGLRLLFIDPDRVEAEVRFDPAEPGQHYPHIYGPLNTTAVVHVLDLEPRGDGTFVLPGGTENIT